MFVAVAPFTAGQRIVVTTKARAADGSAMRAWRAPSRCWSTKPLECVVGGPPMLSLATTTLGCNVGSQRMQRENGFFLRTNELESAFGRKQILCCGHRSIFECHPVEYQLYIRCYCKYLHCRTKRTGGGEGGSTERCARMGKARMQHCRPLSASWYRPAQRPPSWPQNTGAGGRRARITDSSFLSNALSSQKESIFPNYS